MTHTHTHTIGTVDVWQQLSRERDANILECVHSVHTGVDITVAT